MHATRSPSHRADVPRPIQHQRGQTPPARATAGPDAHLPAGQEFLASFGDAIDDRITEIVDELLEERSSARSHRPGRYLGAVSLLLLATLGASALLRHSPIAWTIWPSAAVISIATAWTGRAGRS
jgi:hypothetical protein